MYCMCSCAVRVVSVYVDQYEIRIKNKVCATLSMSHTFADEMNQVCELLELFMKLLCGLALLTSSVPLWALRHIHCQY